MRVWVLLLLLLLPASSAAVAPRPSASPSPPSLPPHWGRRRCGAAGVGGVDGVDGVGGVGGASASVSGGAGIVDDGGGAEGADCAPAPVAADRDAARASGGGAVRRRGWESDDGGLGDGGRESDQGRQDVVPNFNVAFPQYQCPISPISVPKGVK